MLTLTWTFWMSCKQSLPFCRKCAFKIRHWGWTKQRWNILTFDWSDVRDKHGRKLEGSLVHSCWCGVPQTICLSTFIHTAYSAHELISVWYKEKQRRLGCTQNNIKLHLSKKKIVLEVIFSFVTVGVFFFWWLKPFGQLGEFLWCLGVFSLCLCGLSSFYSPM